LHLKNSQYEQLCVLYFCSKLLVHNTIERTSSAVLVVGVVGNLSFGEPLCQTETALLTCEKNTYHLPRDKLDFYRSYTFYQGSCLGCLICSFGAGLSNRITQHRLACTVHTS